jgi:hypothetical protein
MRIGSLKPWRLREMAQITWSDHNEMKNGFKSDVTKFFGSKSIFIPNEVRISGMGFAFQPDGLIFSYNEKLEIIFPEFKTASGIKDRKGIFFQLGKYNILKKYQRDAFNSITDKLKRLEIAEHKAFIEKHWGSFKLFYEIRDKMKFSFQACLIKEGKDTYFIKFIMKHYPMFQYRPIIVIH